MSNSLQVYFNSKFQNVLNIICSFIHLNNVIYQEMTYTLYVNILNVIYVYLNYALYNCLNDGDEYVGILLIIVNVTVLVPIKSFII